MSQEPYSKAPIAEAVLQVGFDSENSVEAVETMKEVLAVEFPSSIPILQAGAEFRLVPGADPAVITATGEAGTRLESLDKKRVLQVRPGTITFSHLAPYPGWKAFAGAFKSIWDEVASALVAPTIRRVSTRYINRIDIVETGTEFPLQKYFSFHPETPSDFGPMTAFFAKARIPQVDISATLAVSLASAPEQPPPANRVILDIDLFRIISEPEGLPVGELWDYLEVLHTRKNEIFEASITEATRQLIR